MRRFQKKTKEAALVGQPPCIVSKTNLFSGYFLMTSFLSKEAPLLLNFR
jgi:hypothetical protein